MTMAARRNHAPKAALGNPQQWRQKIQTSALLNRLQDFGLGKLELSPAQVNAVKILLAKVLPDLTENETRVSGDLTVNIVQYGSRNPSK